MGKKMVLKQSAAWVGATLFALGLTMQGTAQEADIPVTVSDESIDSERTLDRVFVTGSRIATDSATSAAGPVLSIGAAEIETSGETDIAFLLRETPALNASLPGSFSAFNAADTEDSDLGVGLLNLRNLGIERTLVLQNGRRHVPSVGGQAAVDTSTIPVALIERVEVLTGGASSIYGADAVSGVVNFILRDGSSFDGLEYRFQAGISAEGDAEDYFASIATGLEFNNGRGDAVIGVEYSKSTPVFASDRSFAGSGLRAFGPNSAELAAFLGVDPDAANTFAGNRTLPISSRFGIIAIGDGSASAFVNVLDFIDDPTSTIGSNGIPIVQIFDNGTLRTFNPGDIIVDAFNAVGGDAIAATPDSELILPDSERIILSANTKYQLHPNINFFLEGKYAFTDTRDSAQVNGFNDDIPIALDNAFIPQALRNQITSLQAEGINPVIAISRDTLDSAVIPLPRAERETFRIVGGFEGELPGNIDYELSYNYGRSAATITNGNTRIEDRFFAAIDAVVDPATGDIVCRSDLDPLAIAPTSPFPNVEPGFRTFVAGDGQCAPINIFGENTISGPGAEFAFLDTIDRTVVTQEAILATFTGDTEQFFSLPGGAIGWAGGFEYRKDSSQFTPDNLNQTGATFGGNRAPTLPSGGEVEVYEGFFEAKAPLLRDLPFIKYLEASGSVRISDYSTIGSTTTWALGGRYQPHDWVTLRGTYSKAVRAPNIGELFSPQQPASIGATQDPCNPQFINAGTEFRAANCALLVAPGFNSVNFNSAFVTGVSGGNPNLNEEEATTFTIGTVIEPGGALAGLRVIADYYDIEIDGAIDSLAGFAIAQNCVDLPNLNNQFCAQIVRDPTNGNITFFESGQINLGAFEVQGLDFSVIYDFDLDKFFASAPGSVRLSGTGTRFIQFDETPDAAAPEVVLDNLGTFADPEWIVNFAANYTLGDFGFGWRGRFESSQLLPGVSNEDIASDPNFADPFRSGSALVHDFSVDYRMSERLNFYGGINNAFDQDPFVGTLSRPAGPRGRFFFIGIQGAF